MKESTRTWKNFNLSAAANLSNLFSVWFIVTYLKSNDTYSRYHTKLQCQSCSRLYVIWRSTPRMEPWLKLWEKFINNTQHNKRRPSKVTQPEQSIAGSFVPSARAHIKAVQWRYFPNSWYKIMVLLKKYYSNLTFFLPSFGVVHNKVV